MFNWLRKRRRRKLLSAAAPPGWTQHLERSVPLYASLSAAEQQELMAKARILAAEKHFEGCGGFRITEEARVTVAGNAALLILNRPTAYFPALKTILIYPEVFMVPAHEPAPDGTIAVTEDEHAGESWSLGVVVLAWDEISASIADPGDGYNVVLHEFAHQLDQEDGEVDGVPLLSRKELYETWADVFRRDFRRHQRSVAARRRTLIDAYGAEDPAEFFAVATETFFEQPRQLRNRHHDLYAALRDYYQQDPAARLDPPGSNVAT